MDFELSDTAQQVEQQLRRFMDDVVYPNERTYAEQLEASGDPHHEPQIMTEMRSKAKAAGLWNLFLPDAEHGAGLSNLDYTPLCEIMGRSPIASRVFNCQAPDTGNAEILAEFGTPEQKKRWLIPLLEGEIRSCFSMTEPEVSGADPTGLRTVARLEGDEYVIDGHKWFTSGAVGAAFAIVMAATDPDAPPHARQSQIIVPTDTLGFNLIRAVSVMGHTGGGGHCEIRYENCRVPVTNRLGPEHSGFMIAQARLGPGRIHHCMRAIGMAERAFEIMCRHANNRVAFGGPLGEKQFVQEWVATSRMEIDQARLLTLYAAWKMDTYGKKDARQEISMIKVVVPNMMMNVLDRAIQCLGSLGMTDDTPIAGMWRHGRSLRIADGPDEVHKMVIARRELRRFA
ncbi:MAG: acyl-CoA dehydrogenase family protein [Myxococcota bacterium]